MSQHEIWDDIDKLASEMVSAFLEKRAQSMGTDPISSAIQMPTFEELTQTPNANDILEEQVEKSVPNPLLDQQAIADYMDTSVDPFANVSSLFGGGS